MLPLDFKGMDLVRGRDCTVFVKGDTHAFAVSPTMLAGGWVGGQGFQWGSSPDDAPMMTYSTGLYGGVLVWGSDEMADRYTAMTGQFLKYGYAVAMVGNALISTVAFETYTYASRTAGPLVPITYTTSEPLFFSNRGYWTNEDEMTLTGNPRAPAFFAGFVAQVPKALNQLRLGIMTSM